MSDRDRIDGLVKLGSDAAALAHAERAAAKKLLAFDGEVYPADGCAITQSCLLQAAGIAIPDTYQALAFGNLLEKRGWARIAVGAQKGGDIGSTCKARADHGNDHVYLVLRIVNDDEMVIADNQASQPHFRTASGNGGKTPTTHFLRAPAVMRKAAAAPAPVQREDAVSEPAPVPIAGPIAAGTLLQMDNSLMGDVSVVKSLFKSKIAWLSGGLGSTSAASIADANPDLVELLKRLASTPAFWLAVAAIGCAALMIYFRWRDHGRGAINA